MLKTGQPKAAPNPLYTTSNENYGSKPVHPAIASTHKHGKSLRFTTPLGQAGMYRNCSLNTAIDKSRTIDMK